MKLVGYEIKQGIKKSNGKPYYLEILHCVYPEMTTDSDSYGCQVETVVINLLYSGAEPKHPELGSEIRVYYGRTGYPEMYDIV